MMVFRDAPALAEVLRSSRSVMEHLAKAKTAKLGGYGREGMRSELTFNSRRSAHSPRLLQLHSRQ